MKNHEFMIEEWKTEGVELSLYYVGGDARKAVYEVKDKHKVVYIGTKNKCIMFIQNYLNELKKSI